MANKIVQFIPVTKWGVKKTDNGFEYLIYEFTQIDSTHTEVSMSFNLDLGKTKGQIISLLAQTEIDTNMIPLVKQVGNGVSINRANFGLGAMGKESFVITHPDQLQNGYEIKIGTASAIVSTSTDDDAIWSSVSRFTHHANGHYWVAFYDGSNPVIYSSSDASTWNSQGDIPSTDGRVEAAMNWSARFSGTNIIVAMGDESANTLHYRNATLDSDGGVTWDASDLQVALDGSIDKSTFVLFDSDGLPWAGGIDNNDGGSAFEGDALNGPSWTDRSLPNNANPPFQSIGFKTITGFQGVDSGDVVVITANLHTGSAPNRDIWSNVWDSSGTSWNGWTEIVDADLLNDANAFAHYLSAVKIDNGEIHLVYIDASGNINHIKGSDAMPPSWSSVDADITSLTSHTKLALSSNGTDLWIFYDKGDEKIYWRKWTSGGGWDSENNLKTDTTVLLGAISCFEVVANGEIGVTWVEDGTPNDIVFDTISVGAPAGGRIMGSLSGHGGLAGIGGIAGIRGGIAG